MSFPRYPKYKDSGVAWLGEVPEHWEVKPLKRGFTVLLGKMLQPDSRGEDDELLSYLRAANVKWGFVDITDIKQMWFSGPERKLLRLEKGDLLVSEGGDVGRSCLWEAEIDDCYFQNSINRVRADGQNSNAFLCFWMRTIKDRGYVDVLCNKSTIAHFTAEKVAALPVPYPPVPEQFRIASFLDRETGKIDELVAEQQRLIELLKEKRQAVISHAVTKGLNPRAPMKPSGIEWLGDVPAHWEMLRLKNISPRISGRLVYQPAQYFADDGVPFLMGNNVTERGIQWENVKLIPEEINKQFSEHALREGDVITVRVGAPGVTCVVPREADGLNCGSLMIIRRSEDFDSPWLAAVMNSDLVRRQIDQVQYGAAQEQINITDAVNFRIPTPPLVEQQAIASFILDETERFDALIAEAEKAIDLLQERRTALISAAVTGQIDVRKLATT